MRGKFLHHVVQEIEQVPESVFAVAVQVGFVCAGRRRFRAVADLPLEDRGRTRNLHFFLFQLGFHFHYGDVVQGVGLATCRFLLHPRKRKQ